MGVISIVNGDYKPTNITGGVPPCMETESERGAVQRPADFHVGRQGETFLVEIFGRRFPHILPQAATVTAWGVL